MLYLHIGVASEDAATVAACRLWLHDLGVLDTPGTGPAAFGLPLPYDLLVLDLGVAIQTGAAAFARCRTANPGLPIIVLGRDVGSDLAVEFVKLGAGDFLSAPPDPSVLRRKVVRLATGQTRPTLGLDMFEALVPRREEAEERRRAFRARVPADFTAWARFKVKKDEVRATLVDLSLEADSRPAGMLVRVLGADIDPAVLAAEAVGGGHKLLVTVPGRLAPVEATGRLVRVQHHGDHAFFDVAFQFRPGNRNASAVIGRFWMQCQTRHRSDE